MNQSYQTEVFLLAVDASLKAEVIPLHFTLRGPETHLIYCKGNIATFLQVEIKNILQLLTRLYKPFCLLQSFHIEVEAAYVGAQVRSTESAQLPIALGLISLYELLQGRRGCHRIAASGSIDEQGRILPVRHLTKKLSALALWSDPANAVTAENTKNLQLWLDQHRSQGGSR